MTEDNTPTPASSDAEETLHRPSDGFQPRRVGPYRVLQRLGAGGMGEVFEAEQLEPVRRRVALKLIKPGMDSKEVLARFETERQALALMDHPTIARVYDAGTTDKGRPYFAMEYVRGLPITRYCDDARLETGERLELFIQVCEGVQHAHQKGIIHRDIKPTNVLVALQDGKPVPKIIDFGVAKATAQPLTDKTMITQLGRFLGTPEYMSPEQAEMSGIDIDTRTDIYSLGALLYELLVGSLPFDEKGFRTGGFAEIQRKIREVEPPRPSTRVSAIAESSVAAERRRTDPAKLARALRGDLDWIVLKAMEKDRARRYATANALALDLRRYLDDEPVRARPPSTAYRLAKFVRRNKLGVAAAALVLVAILVGAAGTAVGLVRARQAERAARDAEQRARVEAETAREVSNFLAGLFEVADPGQAQGATITAREILARGAERIERELAERPATRARMMHTIGDVHLHLGLYDEAGALLEKGLAVREELLGADGLEVAESLVALAELDHELGRYAESRERAERALEIREAALGPESLEVAEALARLGWALASAGDHTAAEPYFRRALDIRTAALEPGHPDLADSLQDLGIVYWRQGDYERAEPLLERALELYERALGPDDYQLRTVLNDLAVIHWSRGSFAEAETLFRRSLEIKERILGPDHSSVASSLNNLAVLFDAQGRYAEAEPLLLRTLAIKEQALGPRHHDVGMALGNLAWVYYRQGKYRQAGPLYSRARQIYEASLGPEHSAMGTLLRDNALLLVAQGRLAEAERMLRRALAIRESSLGPESPDVAECLHDLAALLSRQARWAEAEPLYERALAIRRDKLVASHPGIAETEAGYRELLRRTGRAEQARALAE